MNRICSLTAVICALLSSAAFAEKYETLADPYDKVTLAKGDTAFVLFVTRIPTIQYEKRGRRPVQFRLGLTRAGKTVGRTRYPYDPQIAHNPSGLQPFALAGPATITVMSPGVVSLKIIHIGEDK